MLKGWAVKKEEGKLQYKHPINLLCPGKTCRSSFMTLYLRRAGLSPSGDLTDVQNSFDVGHHAYLGLNQVAGDFFFPLGELHMWLSFQGLFLRRLFSSRISKNLVQQQTAREGAVCVHTQST